jgi:hypothetical protein
MAAAWVVERHAWPFRSRRKAGEWVTRGQAARDVLRSESLRELLTLEWSPYPAWLGIPSESGSLLERLERLASFISGLEAVPSTA